MSRALQEMGTLRAACAWAGTRGAFPQARCRGTLQTKENKTQDPVSNRLFTGWGAEHAARWQCSKEEEGKSQGYLQESSALKPKL